MSIEARDNLAQRQREIWRNGRVVYTFSEREIAEMIDENRRLRSTYNVPPFGSCNPYWPKARERA